MTGSADGKGKKNPNVTALGIPPQLLEQGQHHWGGAGDGEDFWF